MTFWQRTSSRLSVSREGRKCVDVLLFRYVQEVCRMIDYDYIYLIGRHGCRVMRYVCLTASPTTLDQSEYVLEETAPFLLQCLIPSRVSRTALTARPTIRSQLGELYYAKCSSRPIVLPQAQSHHHYDLDGPNTKHLLAIRITTTLRQSSPLIRDLPPLL